MLANVTMQLLIAAAAYHDIQDKKENSIDIKKYEALRSLPWSSTGLSRHAGSGIWINSHGSVVERFVSQRPRRDLARAAHGYRLPDGTGAEDVPGTVCLRHRGLSVTTAGQLPSLSTTGLGIWRHTQGHSYSAESESFIFSSAGVWAQTHRLTRVIEVSNDGDKFTDTVALQIFDTNGNQIVAGCGTSVGSRMK